MSSRSGLDRETPYTTIGVYPEVRSELEALRDEHGFDNYTSLIRALIQNAQEDLSA